jgi:hypothetical protein
MDRDLESSIKYNIGFTEDDLHANRDGKLSDVQRYKLIAKRQYWLQMAGFAVIVAIIFFIADLIGTHYTYLNKVSEALKICVYVAFVLSFIWLKWSRYVSDLERGVVFASEGKLELVPHYSRGGHIYSYEICVNKVCFKIEKRLFSLLSDVVSDNPLCAIYYAPKSKFILSFEVLSDVQ